jgi:hypothetical protein
MAGDDERRVLLDEIAESIPVRSGHRCKPSVQMTACNKPAESEYRRKRCVLQVGMGTGGGIRQKRFVCVGIAGKFVWFCGEWGGRPMGKFSLCLVGYRDSMC